MCKQSLTVRPKTDFSNGEHEIEVALIPAIFAECTF